MAEGCQHHAGVLKGGKLSPGAKERFIKDVLAELIYGTAGIPVPALPCGPNFAPVPFADRIHLEDEKQYPEFHKHVLGMYEKIARALDVQSQYTILPIVDPLALAVSLNLNVPDLKFPSEFLIYGISLPLLAIKLGLEPPELAAKFPSLIKPPIPQITLPLPIDFKQPDFIALLKFSLWPLKMPDLMKNLMLQMPSLFVKLLKFDLGVFCDVTFKSQLFGAPPDFDPNSAVVWATAAKVLARKTGECVSIAVVASTVGSSPGGITGNLGKHYGYTPETQKTSKQDVRSRIVAVAKSMDGQRWSKDQAALASVNHSFSKANLKYTQFLLPFVISPPPDTTKPLPPYNKHKAALRLKLAYKKAQVLSSCGLFMRACYLKGGALDPPGIKYFNVQYIPSTAISGLIDVAARRGAAISYSTHNIPSLKKGDSILLQKHGIPGSEHVLMLTQDFSGGTSNYAYGIAGGQYDPHNKKYSTAIKSTKFKFYVHAGRVLAGTSLKEARDVIRLFDADKIVKNEET